ncbi:uncharacterized protein LOC6542520 isoform X3 [Drosophila erecta]|uniref:uncharacterized protein LOC6542520 isoform X3 n=1 Tax=Drosophila erecta TaxID=7220 RepID=UPI000F046C59|nr:uncharacterized protein LOC6542520 isoform X3 [Drosophila erecta]
MDRKGRNTLRRTARLTRRRRSTGGDELGRIKATEQPRVEPPLEPRTQQRVFLYIQLNEMSKLPKTEHPLELHLYHPKNTLQKMQERYTTETIIYQHEFSLKKPVFAMGVMQDDIEDMNTFSDQPLLISLYQRIPRRRKGGSGKGKSTKRGTSSSQEINQLITKASGSNVHVPHEKSSKRSSELDGEEAGEEGEGGAFLEGRLELLSRGHCDLLQLFQRRRFISDITIYLYPEYRSKKINDKITTCSVWHMYSILPILKNFTFTNLAFLTLESIYNVPEELHSKSAELGLSVSFRSKEPQESDGSLRVIPLCTYSGFISQIISDQNTIIVWENIKRDLHLDMHFSFNQMETNSRIKLPKLLRMLLWEQDVDFQIYKIDPVSDLALINNSLHRFVLNEQMRKILEEAVVHNDYELLLQLYQETPSNVLYEGVLNPSIFGYPGGEGSQLIDILTRYCVPSPVNYCRFACRLSPVFAPTIKLSLPRDTMVMGPMFCTFKICFFQPICERNEPLDKYNESLLKSAKLRRCFDMEFVKEDETDEDVLLELYRAFDDLIRDTIGYIIKRDVQDISDRKDFFCCQLGNLCNLVLKICGCDFNIRMPTKTNIEFREMLTHMYEELMERIEGVFTACCWKNNADSTSNQDRGLNRLMHDMRLVSCTGQRDLAIHMYEEIDHSTTNRIIFDFLTLLNSVETLQFEQAARYFTKPRTTDWSGYYFTLVLQLYINYMMDLRSTDEEVLSTAKSNMIESLRQFADKNRMESEIWILLYCYYKEYYYLPGMELTRWKFLNLQQIAPKTLSFTPTSLYELYLPVDFDMKSSSTSMNTQFFPVFKLFARLGAYAFAEIVFSDIEQCFTEAEAYLITTTLKILQRQIDDKFNIIKMPTDNSAAGKLKEITIQRCYQLHINGSVEYSRGRCDEALRYFQELFSVVDPMDRWLFKLSFLRLGQLAFQRGQYELAEKAFDSCLPARRKSFTANYGKGLTLYHLNRLEEAIPYLSRCTEVDIFIPDVWGYLATINLRLSRNKTALECWKVAKLYPEVSISKSVYAELDKIRYSDVHLLVDDDGNPSEKMSKADFIPL